MNPCCTHRLENFLRRRYFETGKDAGLVHCTFRHATLPPPGYVYTVAMALALLYLYTQHFSYVQAVYLFVVFHAALAGALRAETARNSSGEGLVAGPPVAALLAGGPAGVAEQNWVTSWVPGRGAVLQRTVYFALLACGGALFAGEVASCVPCFACPFGIRVVW